MKEYQKIEIVANAISIAYETTLTEATKHKAFTLLLSRVMGCLFVAEMKGIDTEELITNNLITFSQVTDCPKYSLAHRITINAFK